MASKFPEDAEDEIEHIVRPEERQARDISQDERQLARLGESTEVATRSQQEGVRAVEITGGDFSNATLGPTYKYSVEEGDFRGAVMGNQEIHHHYHVKTVSSKKTEDPDRVQLSDRIWLLKKQNIAKQRHVYHGEVTDLFGTQAIAIKLTHFEEKSLQEAKLLRNLRQHPNVVSIVEAGKCFVGLQIYLAMELCHTVNLYDHIKQSKGTFDPKLRVSQAKQVVEGLSHIHEHKIIHMDLKPDNVLLSLDQTLLKISDFGLGKQLQDNCTHTGRSEWRRGTDGYRAPETYNKQVISMDTDIFSLGLLTFFLLSDGKHPFGDDPDDWNGNIKHNKSRNLSHLLLPNNKAANQLIGWMLEFEPKDRPNCKEILDHRFFADPLQTPMDAGLTTPTSKASTEPKKISQNEQTKQSTTSQPTTRPKQILDEYDPETEAGKSIKRHKEIGCAYGKEEKRSLGYAWDVNKRGVYTVGRQTPELGMEDITLHNCVSLRLQPKDDRETEKQADLDFLHGIESKLMLISRDEDDGEKHISHFVNLLKAVESLAHIYISLIKGGCMLFSSFTAVIASSFTEANTTLEQELNMAVTFRSDIPSLNVGTSLQDLKLLTSILQETDERWKSYIDKKRLEHYYLNDYDIRQIIYLCRELAVVDITLLPDMAYVLLSSRPKQSVMDLIQKALVASNEGIDEKGIYMDSMDEDVEEGLYKDSAGFVCTWNKMQASKMNSGTMISWLQLQERNEQTEAVKNICKGYFAKTLIWTFQDCLSVEHLGRFLSSFRNMKTDKTSTRNFRRMTPLRKGKPNFIICQSNDTIPVIISLYLDNDVNSALPTLSEVLLCNEDTNEDEVERFMRRAMCFFPGKGRPLFCLAYAHQLSFNVSQATERIFERLSQDMENASYDYQMVLLSSDRRHYLSNCFDKYEVELPEFAEEEIREYLAHHFTEHQENPGDAIVKVVCSKRSGVGKSLHVRRIVEESPEKRRVTTLRLQEKHIDNNHVIKRLYRGGNIYNADSHFVHIDLTPAVIQGIDKFIFDLLILGGIQDSSGSMWRRQASHYYAIEMTMQSNNKERPVGLLALLPYVKCLSPREVLNRMESPSSGPHPQEILMDEQEQLSETFQRPYQYLSRYNNEKELVHYRYMQPQGNAKECLSTLLKNCGIRNPSWAELKNFSSFLNLQLKNCEDSVYCQIMDRTFLLQDLKKFAIRFMIRMSQDFATPSLDMLTISAEDESELELHQNRRRWEEKDNPYVFFNEDNVTMTFINVRINREGDLLDSNYEIIEKNVASKELVLGLKNQGVSFDENFHVLPREDKLEKIRRVMGITSEDPDSTYELTAENVLKILAIHIRLRCQIPVILMGETGRGKTRMVEFMSKLKAGVPDKSKETTYSSMQGVDGDQRKSPKNMVTLKMHSGVEVSDIYRSVQMAKTQAAINMAESQLTTVLFFDEANTTTAIHAIKEAMCDGTIDGDSFEDSELRIVATCNPYKRLLLNAIDSVESSGLGYSVWANESNEKLGSIPMHALVYRVVALPPSMQPFVWDFGQLGDKAELIYIQQMTSRLKQELHIRNKDKLVIDNVLSNAQKYMRDQHSECRYVSLRDVERTLSIFKWFYCHRKSLFKEIESELAMRYSDGARPPQLNDAMRCLIQAVGISYHASLEKRLEFRKAISQALTDSGLNLTDNNINEELVACQTVFLQDLRIENGIASNEGLLENIFLMTVCADMKLPLFLIGKPGSSKSLAKAIVKRNMKGPLSASLLYRDFCKLETFSYQCSSLTKPEEIREMFRVASERQSTHVDNYSAVIVMDQVGLAEDSKSMPLQILHQLLDCEDMSDKPLVEKVGFIGISNWALDPAKMNRGIFAYRTTPNENDLITTAKGIFQSKGGHASQHHTALKSLARIYNEVYGNQADEYYGLRDYYNLIKVVEARRDHMTDPEREKEIMEYSLLRNFSGGSQTHQKYFNQAVGKHLQLPDTSANGITLKRMVRDNLASGDMRFLMLLTHQHSSVALLRHIIPEFDKVQVIFGSSFPGDHTYTKICKNIDQIKIGMETGRTVVLLNLPEILESLYALLDQHYSKFGNQKYILLGLGGHKVRCPIAEHFRIIAVERKEVIHKYPIPLINRFEKHDLLSQSLLKDEQASVCVTLTEWVNEFSKCGRFSERDAYVGYHDDSVSAIVLASDAKNDTNSYISDLLQWACADAVFRVPHTSLSEEEIEHLLKIYNESQAHDSLLGLLERTLDDLTTKISIMEVISFSNILTESDREKLQSRLCLPRNSVMLLTLQQFRLEQEYLDKLDKFFKRCQQTPHIDETAIERRTPTQRATSIRTLGNCTVLLVQVSQAHKHGQLLECAKHCLMNRLSQLPSEKILAEKVIIGFLLSTERHIQATGAREDIIVQHTKDMRVVYVDELRYMGEGRNTSIISSFYRKTFGDILRSSIDDIARCTNMENNIIQLVKDCICESMTKIKSRNGDRHLKRIDILTGLCSESGEEAGNGFQRVLLHKMIEIYENAQKYAKDGLHWIATEAMSPEHLQEGGTFGKTLHLQMKRIMADLLAFIVSVIDENDNLDIIFHARTDAKWKTELWLKLFETNPMQLHSMEGKREYSIPFPRHLHGDVSCRFPFSFVINKMFGQVYEASKNAEVFFTMVAAHRVEHGIVKSELHSSNYSDMMQAYAHDVIKFLFDPGTDSKTERDTLVEILFEFSKQKWMENREVDGISVTFFTYMEIFEYLKMISGILSICPITPKLDACRDDKGNMEFKVHESALSDMLEWANDEASSIESEESCVKWSVTLGKIKNIFYPNLELISSDEKKEELREKWKPLSLLDLFLMNLLPGHNTDVVFGNYARVIVPQATHLLHGLRSIGVHSKNFLKIITDVLKRCDINVRLNLLISWGSSFCKRCKKGIQIPVKLPCGHFFCENCVQSIVSSGTERQCPLCVKAFPENFQPTPMELTEKQNTELANFRANCTSFFLEYLDQFCFDAPSEGIYTDQVKRILNDFLIYFETESPDSSEKLETEALDLNLATRSNIFRLLYKRKPGIVTEEVDAWLNGLETPFRDQFILCILKGLEDSLVKAESGEHPIDHSEKTLRQAWQSLNQEDASHGVSLALLKNVARIRFALVNAVDCFQMARGKPKNVIVDRLQLAAVELCAKQKDLFGKFLVKIGLQVYGNSWLHFIRKDRSMKDFIPDQILSLLDDQQIDFWFLLGEDYSDARTTLRSSLGTDGMLNQWCPPGTETSALSMLPKLLAAEHPTKGGKGARLKHLLLRRFPAYGHTDKYLLKKSADITATFTGVEEISEYESKGLSYLVIAIGATVFSKPYMMEELHLLATDPKEVGNLYWPAMPELLCIAMNEIMWQEAAYQCPNGHVYFIGESTRPWFEAKCPECDAVIGGRLHNPAVGNQRLDIHEESETGYQLAVNRVATDNPADRVTQQGAAVIQFFIHSCMLIGYQTKPERVKSMVKDNNVGQFLAQKLVRNLEELAEGLGRSIDDALLVFYEILNVMREKGDSQQPPEQTPTWSSRQERQRWESQFREHYLLPVLQNLDSSLLKARRNLSKAESHNYNMLCRIAQEAEPEENATEISYSHPCLWKTIKYSRTAHLLQCIGYSSRPGEILELILQTPNLHLVQHLHGVLSMQERMIQRFQNKCDMKDVETKTFEDIMKEIGDYEFTMLVQEYIEVWNKVHPLLRNPEASRKKLLDYLTPMNNRSPISMALPSSRGRGRCAKMLSKFLIDIQNGFLENCKRVMKNGESIIEAEVPKLLQSHIVCIDKHRDLLPLIHLHTEYRIEEDEQGRHHHISYNIDALEKQAREKFVMYKKLIKKSSLSCIKYNQDIGIGSDWYQVKKQEPLPPKIIQEVDEAVEQVTPADICEGVRTLTYAISFLAKIEGLPTRKLRDYLENDLKLSSSNTSMIPRSTLICHTLALYARLTWYKSVNFVRQGLEPYREALYGVDQEMITDRGTLERLKEAFQYTDQDSLQQHLNEMLIKVPDFRSWWSLRETFEDQVFIEHAPSDAWYSRIPQELCFKHVADLFRLSVLGVELEE